VGAHLGFYTRIFSDLVGKKGRVVAFEPCPENLPVLQYNLSRRRYKNVQIVNKAVSSHNGQATLFVAPGHSMHSLNAGYTEEQGRINVETVSLDNFLADLQIARVGFIKIDVEGAEPMVLAGMRQLAASSPDLALLVEYNPVAMRAGGFDPKHMLTLLSELGFDYRCILEDGSLVNLDPASDRVVNLACRRRAAEGQAVP
jgi:FkbM family methyltransferase